MYVNLRSNPIYGYLPDILPARRLSLRQLDLSWTKIRGPIPWKTLSLYENLTALQLGHNWLNGSIESAVGLLECLEIFTIGENHIRGEIPSAFQRLRHITALDFSFLQLKGHISQLFNLTRLRYAFLAGNSISGLFPSDFHFRFPELIRLQLNNNSISGSIPSDIAMPQNLTVLDLARNRIEGEVPRSFLNVSSLYFLDLSRNNLTGFAPNAQSANSPSLQYIDFSFNPFKHLTTKRLSELFIRTERSGSPILTFDFTSTNLEGPLVHLLWNKDLNVVAFRLANNRLSSYFLKPRYEQYYVQVVNVSNNRLRGAIPEEINLLQSIKVLDVRGNWMKSSLPPRLPQIAEPMYEVMTLTGANATYKCPEVRLVPTNGRLYVDSDYYKNVLCQCVPGHYGFDGACRRCFRLAFCPGNAFASPMIMDRNTFPVPNPDNVTHLIHCDSVYANTYPCNRRGQCTCRLNDDRATTSCNRSCLCDDNAIGQLCSQCRQGYYRNGYKCYPCPTLSQKQSIALCFVAVLALGLFLLIWFNFLRQFRRFKTRCFKIFLLVGVVCFSVVVVCFGFFRIVPAWMTEVYCFLLLLASFSRLNVLKSFVLTLVMYVQILDSLSVTAQQIDCPYCSFSATLKAIHVYKATKWFQNVANFNFYGFACIFPGLFTPIGRLAFLAILPLAGSAVGFLLRLLNHATTLRKKTKQRRRTSIVKANKLKEKRYLSSKVKRSSKQLLLLLLNIFYFPIANQVIKILLPCHHVPNSNISFMKAYPWIGCSTSQYKTVFAFAVVVTATYITFTPIVFFCLAARRIDVARRNRRFLKKSSIDTLYSGYKKPYQKFMTSLLMIRRLAVAVVVAAFPYNHHDVQAIPFNVIVLGFAFFIAKVQPFRSTTPWNLESWVDVAASFAIVITYNCMTNSRRGSILSESLVLAVNVGLVIFIVVSSVVHLRLAFHSRHRRATQKLKIRHGGQYRHSDELICKF